jgi:HEPN domain-containing protein
MSDWLEKAGSDLEMVRRAMMPPPDLAQAAYHLQRSAQKAVKALLAHLGIPYPRTGGRGHDIKLAATRIPSTHAPHADADALAGLTPWATAFRYPDDDPLLASVLPTPAEIDAWRSKVEIFIGKVAAEIPKAQSGP